MDTSDRKPQQNLKYKTWKTLDRPRAEVAKIKKNLVKWKKEDSDLCECGSVLDEKHLLGCPMMEVQCKWTDLFSIPNDAVTKVINYWTKRGI